MDFDRYVNIVTPYIKKAVKKDLNVEEIAHILKERVSILSEIPEMIDFLDELPEYEIDLYTNKKMKTNPEVALASLKNARDFLESLNDWNHETIHDGLMNLAQSLGIKNGQLLYPVRVALSGKAFTPGGAIEIAEILGKQESLKRIDTAIAKLS